SLPFAMTGADWPGKSTTHSASSAETLSGNPVSLEIPLCSGPRQLSQPWMGALASAENAREGKTRKAAKVAKPRQLRRSINILFWRNNRPGNELCIQERPNRRHVHLP